MTPKIPESNLLTIEAASDYLGVEVGTMRRLRRLDRVRFEKIGAKLFTRKAFLDEYIAEIFGDSP